jgi:uncharacterized protein YfdQ (DUF2303 family)
MSLPLDTLRHIEACSVHAQRQQKEDLESAIETDGIYVAPSHYTVHDLERMLPRPRRQRGTYSTNNLQDFASFVAACDKTEQGQVFIDPAKHTATCIFNLGSAATPGHGDHKAIYTPEHTAAYACLRDILRQGFVSQTSLAEWLEDWQHALTCTGPEAGEQVTMQQAIAAVRNLTVEAARTAESAEQSLSASRSSLESVKAYSKTGKLPAWAHLSAQPYKDLPERKFDLRLSVKCSDKAPLLALRLAKAEQVAEEIAAQTVEAVRAAIAASQNEPLPVRIGTYSPASK